MANPILRRVKYFGGVSRAAWVVFTWSALAQALGWQSGGKWHPLYLVPNTVMDFSSQRPRPVLASALQFKHFTVHGFDSNQSPVFSDSPAGMPTRALAGGVVVSFEASVPEYQVRAWAARESVVLGRLMTASQDRQHWLVMGPVGLGSLDLSNRLAESAANTGSKVLRPLEVEPHWWLNLEPKGAPGVATPDRIRLRRSFR